MVFRREEVGRFRHHPDRTTVTSSRPTPGGPIAFWNWEAEHAVGLIMHGEKKKKDDVVVLNVDILVKNLHV